MARYPRLDYTSKDYDSFREDLIALVQVLFPDWTDFGPGNPGTAIIEVVAFVADEMTYYQDRQVNEAFLVTAVERQNVINHLRGIGYVLSTASPASTGLSLSLSSPLGEDYTVPPLTPVQTQDGTTIGEIMPGVYSFPQGTQGPILNVPWLAGTTYQETIGNSDGTASQQFVLGRTPFLLMAIGAVGSEVVTFDGVQWTRVDDFLDSLSTDLHYVVQVDANDVATVITGDGTNGSIPPNGSQGACTYRVGGGDQDNVEAGTLSKLTRSLISASGVQVPLVITNPVLASGGAPRETVEHAKLYGPASLKTQNRSICKEDYEINAEQITGVARALALTSNEDSTIEENTVNVFIVPVGEGAASDTLLGEVQAQLTTTCPRGITTRLNVFTAPYHNIALATTVYCSAITDPNAQAVLLNTIAAAVMAALSTTFDPTNIDDTTAARTMNFGQRISLSKMTGLVQDVNDVDRLDQFTTPSADVLMTYLREFPLLAPMSLTSASSVSLVARINFAATGTTAAVSINFIPDPDPVV